MVTETLTENRRVEITRYAADAPSYAYRRDTMATADTLYARNPERRLLAIDREQSQQEASAEADAAANAIFLTLDAVSEIAAGPQTPEERKADATEDTAAQLGRAEKRADTRRTPSRLA